ncbi:hypothetical protein [Candidatus Desulforudis audaxviator]|uniref:Integral membrane protein n=1 Tax=Desulforudis audaxviator (strain MP104C) TaxID=477974 RepID=B1I5C2_DESAP|nr:hypothetical protein [Candidatus Desulforudis audaxviator]ACA60219.1 hypothetical protein Daud_1721 [Candidatus Desulforudis audaxviator MP104C]AZK60267.1 hypothetical protein Daudx_1724 [Candidatus Desulforudis audaxviator]
MIARESPFRGGFALQALGLLLMLISQGPLWCASGYTLINTGVFLTGWLLPPGLRTLRLPVLALTVLGGALQLTAVTWVLLTGEITNIKYLIPAGLTLVFTGACTIAAGLARHHRLPEARWLPPVLALLIISILVLYTTGAGAPARVLLAAALAVQLSLTVRVYRTPYAVPPPDS